MKSIGRSTISPYSDIFGADLGALTIFLIMDNCILGKFCLLNFVGIHVSQP